MATLLTTKNDLAVKTAAVRKIAKRKFPTNAAPGHPRLPRGCPSPPRALQHAQRCPSEKKRCRIDRPSLQMATFLTTNEPALVKTAPICKKTASGQQGAGPTAVSPARRLVGRQSGSNGSPARLEQLVSSNQPVSDIRAAHADVHWRSDCTRNQIHRQANEAPQNTRQALPRAPQAKSRAP